MGEANAFGNRSAHSQRGLRRSVVFELNYIPRGDEPGAESVEFFAPERAGSKRCRKGNNHYAAVQRVRPAQRRLAVRGVRARRPKVLLGFRRSLLGVQAPPGSTEAFIGVFSGATHCSARLGSCLLPLEQPHLQCLRATTDSVSLVPMLSVVFVADGIDFFWVWSYVRHHFPAPAREYFEAGTVSFIFTVVGILVWLLVTFRESQ